MKKFKVQISETNTQTQVTYSFDQEFDCDSHATAFIITHLIKNLINAIRDILVEEKEFWS